LTDAREGRVSVAQWSLETPRFEYASPIQAPQFFIGRESPKDVWVNQPRQKEKDIGHERGKERVQGH